MSEFSFLGPLASMAGKAFDFMNAKTASNKARDFNAQAFPLRVKQAQKLGIHPLAAIGAGGFASSPPVHAFSDFGSIGQDVSRAVAAGNSEGGRLQELSIKNMELRNQLIEGQIARLQSDQINPAIPMPTSSNVATVGSGVDFTADPRVAMVKPPSAAVETAKFFGYPLIRNPATFSSAQTGQNEFGEWWENIAGIPAAIDAFSRAILMQNLKDYQRGRRLQREYR